MKNLTKHLLYKGTDIGRQNVVWNIAGSFVYALASMVLSFLVIRAVGDDQGGIFPLDFPPGTADVYCSLFWHPSLPDYGRDRRVFLWGLSGAQKHNMYYGPGGRGCVLTLMHGMGRYTADKCMILILLVIYKVIDGYADVYESEFQRQGSLYLTGKSNFSGLFFRSAYFW